MAQSWSIGQMNSMVGPVGWIGPMDPCLDHMLNPVHMVLTLTSPELCHTWHPRVAGSTGALCPAWVLDWLELVPHTVYVMDQLWQALHAPHVPGQLEQAPCMAHVPDLVHFAWHQGHHQGQWSMDQIFDAPALQLLFHQGMLSI